MPTYALQSSNVFAYSFNQHGLTNRDSVFVKNNPAINLAGTNWTVEFWIKPDGNYNNWNPIFVKRKSGSNPGYQGALAPSSGFLSYIDTTNTTRSSTYRLTNNVWSHVAYVFNNGANLQIYVNGTQILACTSVTTTVDYDSELSISSNGDMSYIATTPATLYGKLSNFRMIKGQAIYTGNFNITNFPYQLPNNSIGAHGGQTNVASSLTGNVVLLTCNDQIISSNGNTPHVLNTSGIVTSFAVDPNELQNFSYYFPGNVSSGQNGSVLVTSTTNSLNLNADFTIETWYYPMTNTGVLLERGYAGVGNNSASYILIWDTPNNNLNFAIANANGVAYSVGSITGEAGSLGAPTLNAWNHIAVTRAGNTYRGFLNGALTFTPATNANTPYGAIGRGLTIGGMFNNGQTHATGIPANTISGYISNLRIIRGNSIYNAAFTVSNTAQLLNVTNAILMTGMSPTFEDLTGNHTLSTNGMSEITFRTISPIIANSQINSNATSGFSSNYSAAFRLGRIRDKFDYQNFGQMVNIYAALGQRLSRIRDKFDYRNFGQMINIYATLGQRQTRIRDKFDVDKFASTTPINIYTLGQRQARISDKFDVGKYGFSTPVNIYTVGQKAGRTYTKQLLLSDWGYFAFGSSANNVVSANVEYQFWS